MEYANKTELTSDELSKAQEIIDQLNQLYPENTAYIEDGQIKAYEGLTAAVQNYTEQLYYAAQLEGRKEASLEAYSTMKKAEENMDKYAESLKSAEEEYNKWYKKWEKFQKSKYDYSEKDRLAAKAAGMTLKQYLAFQKESAEANYNNAKQAYTQNKMLYLA